jgi:hypothetical protein
MLKTPPAPLTPTAKTQLQEIIDTLLYYGRAIDSTILIALGSLATATAVTQLLNYRASHPNATIRYHASSMHLHIHSDASYLLSVTKAQSRAGGIFLLSNKPTNKPPDPTSTPHPINGAVHIHCSIMKDILSSATKAETGALFYYAKDAA